MPIVEQVEKDLVAAMKACEAHAATVLNSGLVLVAGGYNGGLLASAELY